MSIFRNLFINAIEAAAGQKVRIALAEASQGADYIFSVTDYGAGIEPDYMDQVFHIGFSTKINYATGEVNQMCIRDRPSSSSVFTSAASV